MTRLHFRFLGEANSPTTAKATVGSPPGSTATKALVDSEYVVIFASLLCALVCVLGLVAVTRCAWIRRISGGDPRPSPSTAKANKGLKQKVIRSLPKLIYGSDSPPKLTDCPICLAEFAAGDAVRVLPVCGHGFHVSCIDTWLGSHSSCPSCRQILVVSDSCRKCDRLPDGSTGSASESENRFKEREDYHNHPTCIS